ncbi:THIOSULFATE SULFURTRANSFERASE/RHODANESE-LIKE DOMAIN-CONTAINING PROTEIN 2 [Salix viminalis]|uniref:THIOSULFATE SULFURTRANSFERASE/RHODANESE-LIKE DOMAIN-CONTAINING PROTEIN 2 n=1 Tax=Salix viminalis TaxID=40686 RepID=A0A9Q0ZKF6_SALVM|nr:THIOSULFATE SULFURTRANSFERASE/RHODANESE-LIKE DOMAIN-CONTAINING PROTEIN 2 [Salix viminalis]
MVSCCTTNTQKSLISTPSSPSTNSNCTSLSLLGRVRLSLHGVNVTVGGKLSSLEKHIEAVKAISLFEGTDFKLASCHFPLNDKVAHECGFTSLSIRIVKELVTFTPYPLVKAPDVSNAGRHLSAVEFHSALQSAGKLVDKESLAEDKGLVLLDARNLYETRIGKFDMPNVDTLDPRIRQYSDLPSWIDDNSEQLRGKNVLMYCTGGIRCEMASAYIRSKGAGFENVFQLYGGIQRYLEQFPDGGFFKGKNFVFDHRISVGSSDTNILGTCLLCGLSFDDYSSRCRCSYCRMLVLVCDSCREEEAVYVCELCQKHGKILSSRLNFMRGQGKNASGFKGRTASLAKKLKNIAELVFVDAPHELPFIYHPCVSELECSDESSFSSQQILPRQKLAGENSILSGWDHLMGILGFSQGAAMAALLCAQKARLKGKDRQIANKTSRELSSLFEDGCSVIIEHDCGHIIPTRTPYIDEIKGFLQRFL